MGNAQENFQPVRPTLNKISLLIPNVKWKGLWGWGYVAKLYDGRWFGRYCYKQKKQNTFPAGLYPAVDKVECQYSQKVWPVNGETFITVQPKTEFCINDREIASDIKWIDPRGVRHGMHGRNTVHWFKNKFKEATYISTNRKIFIKPRVYVRNRKKLLSGNTVNGLKA